MDHGRSAQQMAYEEREQRWEAASSPSATPEDKFVPNYSEEPEDDLQARKWAREYFSSRSDLTSDNQLKTISLKGGVISVYITLTLGASWNPQNYLFIPDEVANPVSWSIFQTPPSMIMWPLHQ